MAPPDRTAADEPPLDYRHKSTMPGGQFWTPIGGQFRRRLTRRMGSGPSADFGFPAEGWRVNGGLADGPWVGSTALKRFTPATLSFCPWGGRICQLFGP
jgi:hypothetical protein